MFLYLVFNVLANCFPCRFILLKYNRITLSHTFFHKWCLSEMSNINIKWILQDSFLRLQYCSNLVSSSLLNNCHTAFTLPSCCWDITYVDRYSTAGSFEQYIRGRRRQLSQRSRRPRPVRGLPHNDGKSAISLQCGHLEPKFQMSGRPHQSFLHG